MYVGYMYTNGDAHGTGTSSIIKINADKFYTDKLIGYASKLDTNAGFCGDRSTYNTHANVGISNTITYYKANTRFNRGTPTLTCENNNDYYTSTTSASGNKRLTYSIGLISLDEAVFAGYAASYYDRLFEPPKNANGYLSLSIGYWTMTPSMYAHLFGFPQAFALNYDIGQVAGETYVDSGISSGLRPVINLKSNVIITGTGTMTDPYIVN